MTEDKPCLTVGTRTGSVSIQEDFFETIRRPLFELLSSPGSFSATTNKDSLIRLATIPDHAQLKLSMLSLIGLFFYLFDRLERPYLPAAFQSFILEEELPKEADGRFLSACRILFRNVRRYMKSGQGNWITLPVPLQPIFQVLEQREVRFSLPWDRYEAPNPCIVPEGRMDHPVYYYFYEDYGDDKSAQLQQLNLLIDIVNGDDVPHRIVYDNEGKHYRLESLRGGYSSFKVRNDIVRTEIILILCIKKARSEPLHSLMTAIRDMWKDHEQRVRLCVVYSPADPRQEELFDSVTVSKFSEDLRKQQLIVGEGKTGMQIQLETLDALQKLEVLERLRTHTFSFSSVKSARNRYTNVHLYEYNRVRLEKCYDPHPTHSEECYYMSASRIHSDEIDSSNVRFITAQAPKLDHIDEFWQMVWENNVAIIVMLTKLKEGEKTKADRYWPERVNGVHECKGSGIVLRFKSAEVSDACTERTLELKLGSVRRIIKHISYEKWPDFGVPTEYKSLRELIIDYRREIRELPWPVINHSVVIHCSAGIGRTGTFLAINMILDHILQSLKRREELDRIFVNVFNTVYNLRLQRPSMVQTVDQYTFIFQFLVFCIRDTDQFL